jgi:hypothetical protein
MHTRDRNESGINALIRAGGGTVEDDQPSASYGIPRGGPLERHSERNRKPLFVGASEVAEKLTELEKYAASLNADFQGSPEDVRSEWTKYYGAWLKRVEEIKGKTWLALNVGARGLLQGLLVDERELGVWRAKLEAAGIHPSSPEPLPTPASSFPGPSTGQQSAGQDLPREVIFVGAENVKEHKGFTFSSFLKWFFAIAGVFGLGYVLKSFAEAAHGTSGFVQALRGGEKAKSPVTTDGKGSPDEMAIAQAIADARAEGAQAAGQPMAHSPQSQAGGWRPPIRGDGPPILLQEYEYFEPPPPPPRTYERASAVITLPDGRSAPVRSPEHAAELLRNAPQPPRRPWYR